MRYGFNILVQGFEKLKLLNFLMDSVLILQKQTASHGVGPENITSKNSDAV